MKKLIIEILNNCRYNFCMTNKTYEFEKFCRKLVKQGTPDDYKEESFTDDPKAVKEKDYSRYYPKSTHIPSKSVISNNH